MQAITLAITGASGAPYALRLLETLISANRQVYLLLSSAAKVVLATEAAQKWPSSDEQFDKLMCEQFHAQSGQVVRLGKEQWFSPVASGSSAPKQMVVCPCSMGTLSAICQGSSDNLIERAADVVIKERGHLILVPREMPLSAIHLENMLKLARLGVDIMPAAPGFYHQPQTINDLIDHVVGRILDHLGIDQSIMPAWGYDGCRINGE
ncbi:flavin prenyltransferase UbiX [Celerinatantimonas sp. MCCC 1A17872]|uniref:flavin prenyltransferase UbiX n=1 Tax=Celerinatantimonas sp. MCCC 1A17872 TaxID=3177514 RepID=UPI0038C79C0C